MRIARTRRTWAFVSCAAVATGLGLGLAPVAQAANGRTSIDNTVPRWLNHATKNTVTPFAATTQTARVYLTPNGGLDALKAAVTALSTPGSAQYRRFLTPAQYQATYAPTHAQVDQVTGYLSGAGLTVGAVEPHHRYVEVSGSTAALSAAFGTALGSYTHDGQTVTAPSSAVTLPTAVAANVLTVTGLDTTSYSKTPDNVRSDQAGNDAAASADRAAAGNSPTVKPPDAFQNARPCSTSFGQLAATYQADFRTPLPQFEGQTLSYAVCGYTGPQFRSAYEGTYQAGTPTTGLDGSGATVAITDAYAWQKIAQDANQYAVAHGDGAYASGQLTQNLPTSYRRQKACDPSGWSGEETLDVEAVHAMAPGAKIRYYGSSSCGDDDFLDTLGRVVDEGVAQLVTNSWSDVESNESAGNVAAYEQVFLQGAAEGQSFLFSSGDSGDEVAASGLKQVGYPSSDPYVTGAGGTSTGIDKAGALSLQTGWGTVKENLTKDSKSWSSIGFTSGAGGGYSSLFNRPTFQDGVVKNSSRGVPDVAMDADPNTGMLVGQTQKFSDGVRYGEYRIGGTSLASPLLAGFGALAVQKGGGGFGLLNPLLYQQAPAGSITDIKGAPKVPGVVRADYTNPVTAAGPILYSVRLFDLDSSLTTVKGWDDVTGLGVPNPKLLDAVTAAP